MRPFFGYPGGKSKAAKKIFATLSLDTIAHKWYVEPFAGGFSMGLHSIPITGAKPWINDIDVDLYSLWVATIHHTEELCDLVCSQSVTKDTFYELQEKILYPREFAQNQIMERAIDKLVVHKVSFSGMGEMAWSPAGGKNQTGKWKFDRHWNVNSICDQILKVSKAMKGAKVTCFKYQNVLQTKNKRVLLYVDPPYVEAGRKCYKHSFTEKDHRNLASLLVASIHKWIVSYDDHPLVQELYAGFNVMNLDLPYYMSSRGRKGQPLKKVGELLITNF